MIQATGKLGHCLENGETARDVAAEAFVIRWGEL